MNKLPGNTSKTGSHILAAELMPDNADIQKILAERAAHFAINTEQETEVKQLIPYIKFQVGEKEHYGIVYHHVNEVMANVHITPLPRLPNFIAGIINYHGNLIAVLDIKKLFHITDTEDAENNNIIIVNVNNMILGIQVNSIDGSDSFDKSLLDPPIVSDGITNLGYITGLHNGHTTILNMDYIFSDTEFKNNLMLVDKGDS